MDKDNLQSVVDEYIKQNPEKYKVAQQIGEQIMDYNYDEIKIENLDKIRLDRLMEALKFLSIEDLDEEDIKFLHEKNICN